MKLFTMIVTLALDKCHALILLGVFAQLHLPGSPCSISLYESLHMVPL
jgi:hypothetical protein